MLTQEVHGLLSIEECDRLKEAVVESLRDQSDDSDDFDFDRTHVLNHDLATLLEDRLQSLFGRLMPDKECYVHPSFAYTRYNRKGHLGFHRDGHKIENGARSIASLLLYLNSDFEGGQTEFEDRVVQPEIGKGLLLPQDVLHRAAPVSAGTKYLIRTDVMVKDFAIHHDKAQTEKLYATLFNS